jgi:hypothetical protein
MMMTFVTVFLFSAITLIVVGVVTFPVVVGFQWLINRYHPIFGALFSIFSISAIVGIAISIIERVQ